MASVLSSLRMLSCKARIAAFSESASRLLGDRLLLRLPLTLPTDAAHGTMAGGEMLAVKGATLGASAVHQMVAAKMAALRTESPEAVTARLKTASRTDAIGGVLAAVFVR